MVGQTISHYQILTRLGGGGMGVVYQARDLRLGRDVAVKFVAEHQAQDRASVDRFEREARAASRHSRSAATGGAKSIRAPTSPRSPR